jgi:hypothetical protein
MGRRFNITLEDRQYTFLTEESERLSVSVAELIRRAVDSTFGLDPERKTPGVELSVALWRRPDAAVVGRRAGVRLGR